MHRQLPQPSNETRQALLEADAKHNLIPFVGAGFTTNINPKASFDELLADCANRSFSSGTDLLAVCGNDSARALDFVIWKLGEQKRYSNTRSLDCYRAGKQDLYETVKTFLGRLQVHGALPRDDDMRWEQHRALLRCYDDIITTNWDNTLESAGMAQGFCCHAYYSANGELLYETLGNGATDRSEKAIIKFHGHLTNDAQSYGSPSSLVASETDYYRRVRRSDPLDDDRICRLATKGVLFIGYSRRDVNVRYVLKQVNTVNHYFLRTHPSYWVIPEPMPDDIGDELSELYRECLRDDANITICPLGDWSEDDKAEWTRTSSKAKATWFADRQEVIRKAWVKLFDALGEDVPATSDQ